VHPHPAGHPVRPPCHQTLPRQPGRAGPRRDRYGRDLSCLAVSIHRRIFRRICIWQHWMGSLESARWRRWRPSVMKVLAGSCELQVVSASDRRRVVVVVFSLNGNLRKQAVLLARRHTWRSLVRSGHSVDRRFVRATIIRPSLNLGKLPANDAVQIGSQTKRTIGNRCSTWYCMHINRKL